VQTTGLGGPEIPATDDRVALRLCVLAVAVLHDVDLVPDDDGVGLSSGRHVSWDVVRLALGPLDATDPAARAALAHWLLALRSVAWRSPDDLEARARPVGLPRGHVLHQGPSWVREHVPGGDLDLGLGFVGTGSDPDGVEILPAGVLEAVMPDSAFVDSWWKRARDYLEEMGELAAERYRRRPTEPLRPMGDCDVVTLLGAVSLRKALCGQERTGLCAAAVPNRTRGWIDLSRTDPAFALVAASLAEAPERGFSRPLLLTREEVVMARAGGDPVLQSLREQAAPDPVQALVPRR
jgi:hypothetical protein